MTFPFCDPILYYDPQGQPGEREYTWDQLDERLVARTEGLTFEGQPVYLSTILLANAMVTGLGAEFDKPFETQLRSRDREEHFLQWRYPTRAAAEETHAALVEMLRNDAGRAALEKLARIYADEDEAAAAALAAPALQPDHDDAGAGE